MRARFTAATAALFGLSSWAAVGFSQTTHTPNTVKELMLSTTVPASTVIFDAQAEPPTNRQGWVAVEKAAETLAESGRQLTRPPLARSEDAWREMAEALVTQSLRTAAAARKQDADGLLEAGDDVYGACDTCHKHFIGGAR